MGVTVAIQKIPSLTHYEGFFNMHTIEQCKIWLADSVIVFFYLIVVKSGTPVRGNDHLTGHLKHVERVALAQGLPPEEISNMLEFAMSMRLSE